MKPIIYGLIFLSLVLVSVRLYYGECLRKESKLVIEWSGRHNGRWSTSEKDVCVQWER